MDRRSFLKTCGLAASSTLIAGRAGASRGSRPAGDDPLGILIDTTKCVGCHSCSEACAEAHGLPEPNTDDDVRKDTTPTQWTVVNRFEVDGEEIFAKRQCMHCLEPACVSACLTEAMHRTADGAVVWDNDRCMGCRYCMVSCPFDMPKYEYASADPRVQKCKRCYGETAEGEGPACVEACPEGALTFGRRSELLAEAHKRIAENPDDYIDHIYGEHEAGGTAMLYLASKPFESLGMRGDLGTRPYPEYTKEFLYGVPLILAGVPAMLLGMSRATRGNRDVDAPSPTDAAGRGSKE
jgi:Fe-S-cluster-containing dehydrogenase component